MEHEFIPPRSASIEEVIKGMQQTFSEKGDGKDVVCSFKGVDIIIDRMNVSKSVEYHVEEFICTLGDKRVQYFASAGGLKTLKEIELRRHDAQNGFDELLVKALKLKSQKEFAVAMCEMAIFSSKLEINRHNNLVKMKMKLLKAKAMKGFCDFSKHPTNEEEYLLYFYSRVLIFFSKSLPIHPQFAKEASERLKTFICERNQQ